MNLVVLTGKVLWIGDEHVLQNGRQAITIGIKYVKNFGDKQYDRIIKAKAFGYHVDFIKNNIKETKINFKDLNDLKKESISNFQLERKLVDTVLLINKIQDDFPELEEQKDYRQLLNDIRVMDERINASKKFYNKYTSKSNELVRKFPSNIIAKFHNITIRNFFDNKDMNDDIINDFKL